jgi:hypothetical protein
MMLSLLFVTQALTASDLQPSGFYVAGVQQGMTVAEYNSMISNGGFRSQPMDRDTQWAAINGRDVIVRFCEGRVVDATASYNSVDWLTSIQALERAGIRIIVASATLDQPESEMRSGQMSFGVTMPRGFSYGVMPVVKAMTIRDRDLPAFQLHFTAIANPCRAAA